MKLYITDNPEIKKEIPGSILAFQLLMQKISTRIDVEDEEVVSYTFQTSTFRSRRIKGKIETHSKIALISAPSNYKLIQDILYIQGRYNKKIDLYTWSGWFVKKPYSPDKKKIDEMFEQYVLRGFVSRRLYETLGRLNFIRIEQLITLFCIIAGEKGILQEEEKSTKRKDLFILLSELTKKTGSFEAAYKKLSYIWRKVYIQDPFLSGKILIYKHASEKKTIKDIIMAIQDGKKQKKSTIEKALERMSKIMPIYDAIRNMESLFKNSTVKMDGGKVVYKYDIDEKMVMDYFPYIDPQNWKSFYKSRETQNINQFFPYISIGQDLIPVCPICKSSAFITTPYSFTCKGCGKFKIKRMINPLGKEKRLKREEFKRLVTHGWVLVKNKDGGYSKYVLHKNKNGTFFPMPTS